MIHVVRRSRSGVSDERTASGVRKRKRCRKSFVECDEWVRFMAIDKPKENDEIQNCKDRTRYLVDRSDEVVAGTIDRIVEARAFCLSHAGGGAT